ncbi:MAG: zinc-binding alcohol dehydrogenase, partial [Rhodomicrobium sp.]
MKQVLQHLRTGATEVAEVPAPRLSAGHVLIRTTRSLVSAGTERMLMDFGKGSLIEKARREPDKVRMVLDKVKTDGLLPTIEAVRNKLDQPLALGYCNAGRVIEVGPGVAGFAVGDRVASNGKHAEVVSVPANLCAKTPDTVPDDAAAFTVLGAIALQGIRLVAPTLGETIAVSGLGLIGLIAVQLLRAHGCRVLGLDFNGERLALARRFGAEVIDLSAAADPVRAAAAFTRGYGADGVIIA